MALQQTKKFREKPFEDAETLPIFIVFWSFLPIIGTFLRRYWDFFLLRKSKAHAILIDNAFRLLELHLRVRIAPGQINPTDVFD